MPTGQNNDPCVHKADLKQIGVADEQGTGKSRKKGQVAHDHHRPPIGLEDVGQWQRVVSRIETRDLVDLCRVQPESLTEDLGGLAGADLTRVHDLAHAIARRTEPTRHPL